MWRYDITELLERIKEDRAMYWWRRTMDAWDRYYTADKAGKSRRSAKWHRRYLRYKRLYYLWSK